MIKIDFLLFGVLFWNTYSFFKLGRLNNKNRIAILCSGIIHYLLNGARWQLYPAYFLSITLLLLNKNAGKPIRYFIGIITSISLVVPSIVPIISFPSPSGEYATGSLINHWVDESREEWFTAEN